MHPSALLLAASSEGHPSLEYLPSERLVLEYLQRLHMRLPACLEIEVFGVQSECVARELGLPCRCSLDDYAADLALGVALSELAQVASAVNETAQVGLSSQCGGVLRGLAQFGQDVAGKHLLPSHPLPELLGDVRGGGSKHRDPMGEILHGRGSVASAAAAVPVPVGQHLEVAGHHALAQAYARHGLTPSALIGSQPCHQPLVHGAGRVAHPQGGVDRVYD